MSALPAASPELRDAVFDRLMQNKDEGTLTANDVRLACQVIGCHQRTIYRWLAAGRIPSGKRDHWTPSDDERLALLRHGGSIANYRETLLANAAEGERVMSERTMQRGFARHYAQVTLKHARSGFEAARGSLPTTSLPDMAVNDEWRMDDNLIPVYCVLPDGTVGKVWKQSIQDGGSRRILSWEMSPFPFTTEDAVANLVAAMMGHYDDNHIFVGGQPRGLRSDRGSIFVNRAVTQGLLSAKIMRTFSRPYEPEGNGGIERFHRTYKSWLRHLPGFDWSVFKQGDPRKAREVPPAKDLLLYDELVAEVSKVIVHRYNHVHVHSAHGMTPAEAWAKDVAANPALIRHPNPVTLRAAMTMSKTRKLRRRRIEWDGRYYDLHPQEVGAAEAGIATDPKVIASRKRRIDAMEGRDVSIRFLPSRVEFLSVYTLQGEFLGDAVWEKVQTPEQVGESVNARREHIRTMNEDMETIALQDAAAVAARKAAALAATPVEDEDDYGPSPRHKSKGKHKTRRTTTKSSTAKTRAQQVDEARRAEALETAELVANMTA